jgi:hypothetical protein
MLKKRKCFGEKRLKALFSHMDGLVSGMVVVPLLVSLRFRNFSRKTMKLVSSGILFALLVVAAVSVASPKATYASTGINQELSFEGKIVSSTGTNITDGNYNAEFIIYTGCTNEPASNAGCTAVWAEDYLTSNSTYASTLPVTFTSGTFQVNLGSICTFSGSSCEGNTNSAINWDTYPLYVSINVGTTAVCAASFSTCGGGTGAMNPYILLTSSPYAMNSNELGGLASSQFGQLGLSQTWTGTNVIQTTATNALQVANGSNVSVLTADTSGKQVLLGQGGTSGANGQLIFNSATASSYAVTLNTSSSLAASYTLTMPTAAPSTGQCLQSGASTASQLSFGTCATLQSAYNGGQTINTTAGGTLSIAASAAPTANMVNISNAGQGVASNNVNDLGVNFVGGATSSGSESAGMRIDYTPGSTSGSYWDGLHIVNATGSGAGVTSYGLKIDGNTGGTGTDEGIKITTGFDIGVDIDSGGMQMADMSSAPAAPASGELRVYARLVSGRSMLSEEGPAGVTYAVQPSLFQQNVVLVTGGNGTSTNTYTTMGSNVTATGTLATTSGSSSEALGNTSRMATGTTSGNQAGFYTKNAYYRGSMANGADGFFYFTRMNLDNNALSNYETSTGARIFMGMCGSTYTNCVSSDTPTTSNVAGFQLSGSRGDAQFQFVTCNASLCNVTSTGVTVAITDSYDLYTYCPPEGTTVYWRIDDNTTGTAPVEGSTTTDLPTASSPLYAGELIQTLTSAARYLYFQRMYFETDR